MVQLYYHDNLDTNENYTDAHHSGEPALELELENIGVFYRSVPSMSELDDIARERRYRNRDIVDLSPETVGSEDAFKAKLDTFYAEHYHDDEEIRYVVDGEGYFDMRTANDRWIRARVEKHDLLVLPAGIYHRFTVNSGLRYIKAIRLFKDQPKWEAIPRGSMIQESRLQYEKLFNVQNSIYLES